MKRIILLLAIVAASVGLAKAQQPMATLSHEGTLTQFQGEGCIGAAHTAAVDGDTIYLSAGQFTRTGLTNDKITKDITLIGSGRESHILGNLIIMNPKDTIDHTICEGLYVDILSVYPDGTETKRQHGFSIKNCKVNKITFVRNDDNTSGIYSGIHIDRSEIGLLNLIHESIGSVTVTKNIEIYNSKIKTLNGGPEYSSSNEYTMKISNSNIFEIDPNGHSMSRDYFFSCIINSETGNSSIPSCEMQNCLLSETLSSKWGEKATLIDCYTTEQDPLDENLEVAAGIDLVGSGFLGVDGTVVGIYGGEWYPYSEAPTLPTPDRKASKVEYDPATDKLKVEIKVAN